MNTDTSFSMFRRFGEMRTRLLLIQQDELVELEEELGRLDQDEATEHFLTSRRADRNEQRRQLMSQIRVKLKAYGVLPVSRCMVHSCS